MNQYPYPNDPTSGPPPMEDLQPNTANKPQPLVAITHPVPGATGDEEAGGSQTENGEPAESPEEARTVKFAIGKLNDFLQWFIVVLEITLLVRFLFKLIGANPDNIFAAFLYALTDIVLYPFSNLVGAPSLHQNQAFEWSTLIAMLIYWLVFFAIRRFLTILISEPEPTIT